MALVNTYLTDTIDIITISSDEWGVITKSTQSGIAARIEDRNELVKNKDGKEVMAKTFVILNKDATITYESKVKLITKNGVAHPLADKEMTVLNLIKAGGFTASHYEVWL